MDRRSADDFAPAAILVPPDAPITFTAPPPPTPVFRAPPPPPPDRGSGCFCFN